MIGSLDLEIADLFEDDNVDDAANVAPRYEDDAVEDNDKDENTANTTKGAAKKIVRKPQPKLDPQRLCGNRGIVLLPKIFSKVKLKGKGYEKDDLDVVMKTLEHWSHRLFPKFTFDDVLERIEKLGSKKAVQNCVNRIRLDMPVLSEDYANDKDDNIVGSDDENATPVIDEQLHATIFGNISTVQDTRNAVAAPSLVVPPVTKELTAEQLSRIEKNRLMALEKRAARLREASQSTATLTGETPQSAMNTSNMSNGGNASSSLSPTKEGHIEQTSGNAMLIVDDPLATLDDLHVITNTKENGQPPKQLDYGYGEDSKTVCDNLRKTDDTGNSTPEVKSKSLPKQITNAKNSMESDNMQMQEDEININTNPEVIQMETPCEPLPEKEKCFPTASSGGLNVPIGSASANDSTGLIKIKVSDLMEEHEPMEVDG